MQKMIALLMAVLLAGCATGPKSTFGPMDARTTEAVGRAATVRVEVEPGKTLAYFNSSDQAKMATGMLFGPIGGAVGAAAAISSAEKRGMALATEVGMPDPAMKVADLMRAQLAPRRPTAEAADLQVVLTTSHWVLQQGNVAYFVQLQATDRASGQLLTKGECKVLRKKNELQVAEEALLANAAARLKQEYGQAAEQCAGYFVGQLFPG